MQMIATEISELGIVMVATRSRLNGGSTPTPTLTGGPLKLHFLPTLRSAIAGWGSQALPTSEGYKPLDVWLETFLDANPKPATLEGFAQTLARELDGSAGEVGVPMGFHLAGYIERSDRWVPAVYHVHNNQYASDGYGLHAFKVDCAFGPHELGGKIKRTLGCDNRQYERLFQAILDLAPHLRRAPEWNLDAVSSSLERRAAYLLACARFTSDLCAISGVPGPSKEIVALSIPPTGSPSYYLSG